MEDVFNTIIDLSLIVDLNGTEPFPGLSEDLQQLILASQLHVEVIPGSLVV